jgi:hypothetical protein
LAIVWEAVVPTLKVTVVAPVPTLTCRVEPEFVPLVKLHVDSLALGSTVQASDTAPVNPPFEVIVSVFEPLWPGLAIVT